MLGVAAFVIGLTWWLGRSEHARYAPSFILYNLGIGVLFAMAATSRSLIPWILAVTHLAAATIFAVVVAKTASRRTLPD